MLRLPLHVCLGRPWPRKYIRSSSSKRWGLVRLSRIISSRIIPNHRPNRAIAVAQNEGPERGLQEIRGIAAGERLANYPFYHAALGEFELQSGKHEAAREHFRAALTLARNSMERRFLDQRVSACE